MGLDADLERVVEFQNRFATPGQWQSPQAIRAMDSAAPDPNRLLIVVEDATGAIVAVGSTGDGGMFRAADGTWRMNLRVAPEWRRRGIGAALLERLEVHAASHDASRTVTAVRGNEPEGARFAQAHGYRAYHERIDSYIDVAAFDASQFEDPDVTAARLGLRFASWGELVAEHAAELEAFQRKLLPIIWTLARDVPAPAPMPAEPPPFEVAKRMFFEGPGIDPGTSILAMRGGEPVGMTITNVKENGTAYTNFTGVARSERGKGIALALKLRALREVKARGVRLFGTTNDEQNAAMRGINRRLGYVPDAPTVMFEKRRAK